MCQTDTHMSGGEAVMDWPPVHTNTTQDHSQLCMGQLIEAVTSLDLI